jgi:ribose transport system substrate-binding protein
MRYLKTLMVSTALVSASLSTAQADEPFVVGILGANYAIPAARAQYEGVAAGLKERGIEYKFLDAMIDINRQVSQIDQFVTEGVDALVINVAGDPNAVLAPLKRAEAAGIPVFGIGGTPGFDALLVQAEIPSAEQGVRSGEYMCKVTGGKGEVAMIKTIELPTLSPRWDMFRETIQKQCPDLKIVAEERAIPDDSATARPIAENLLTRFPDLTAIWTSGDGPALGAGLAAKSAGRDIIVTGLNGEAFAQAGIKQGLINASWDMEPVKVGYDLSVWVADILQGKVEKPTQTLVFTPENVPEWTAETIDQWKPYEERIDFPGLQ